jgi:hypothetical protein
MAFRHVAFALALAGCRASTTPGVPPRVNAEPSAVSTSAQTDAAPIEATEPQLELPTKESPLEAAERQLGECMVSKPPCLELWKRQLAVDCERAAKSCRNGLWFGCQLLYESGLDGIAPLLGTELPAWRWVTEETVLLGSASGTGLVLLPGAQILLLEEEGTKGRIALPVDDRIQRNQEPRAEYAVELANLSAAPGFPAHTTVLGAVAWGERHELALTPGGAIFATTTGQPLVIEAEQRDKQGRRYQRLTEVIRGVRVTGFAQPLAFQVGERSVDLYVYPSDAPDAPDGLPLDSERIAAELQALLEAGLSVYVYPGRGRDCYARTLETTRALGEPVRKGTSEHQSVWGLERHGTHLTLLGPTRYFTDKGETRVSAVGGGEVYAVVEITERFLLVGRGFRHESPVGYRRLGARHWWRNAEDCEAERASDLRWRRFPGRPER